MKKIAIIVAPFGFGPATKAIILANRLSPNYAIDIVSAGHSASFIRKHAEPEVTVLDGVFKNLFHGTTQLKQYSQFICIGQLPALKHLLDAGMGQKTIFIDSTSQWRSDVHDFLPNDQDAAPSNQLGSAPLRYPATYLIEDELPDHTQAGAKRMDGTVVQPILWSNKPARSDALGEHITFHTGGLFNPTLNPMLMGHYISKILIPILTALTSLGREIKIIGPLSKILNTHPIPNTIGLGDLHPKDSFNLITSAALAITTPGLAAVYEGLMSGVPTLLLPPSNSTQIQHYRMFTGNGLTGLMDSIVNEQIKHQVLSLPWPQHANALLKLLSDTSQLHASHGQGILRAISGSAFNDFQLTSGQLNQSLWKQLSGRDAALTIQELLN